MARLPIPGSDSGTWGTILNQYLATSLNSDGTLKVSAVAANGVSQILLIYDTTAAAYPARPAGVPAGRVTYKGPVAPSDAISPDTWEDTTGIWP